MNRYHFDGGNSTSGQIGFCAAVCADSGAEAVDLLNDRLSALNHEHEIISTSSDKPHVDYLTVYFNPQGVSLKDIDEVEDANGEPVQPIVVPREKFDQLLAALKLSVFCMDKRIPDEIVAAVDTAEELLHDQPNTLPRGGEMPTKKLEDALKNMRGAFDTPAMRLVIGKQWTSFVEEAVQSAREAVGGPVFVEQTTTDDRLAPDQTERWKERIEGLSHMEMANLQRFAPPGHPCFDLRYPMHEWFRLRFEALGGMTPEVSKLIGRDPAP